MIKEIENILRDVNLLCVTKISNLLTNAKYRLQKNKNIRYKMLDAPKFNNSVIKENNYIEKKYAEIVEKFIYTMEEKLPKPVLNVMYHNIKTLKIDKNHNLILSNFFCGVYKFFPNVILISTNNRGEATITHELLHMSSSIIGKNNMASGFNTGLIGRSINEGYTEILNNRLFGHPITEYYSYNMYAKFAEIIEDIVGENDMESLYFTADLKGLFEQLSYYSSKEKTSVFLKDLDSLCLGPIISSKCFDRIINYLTETTINYINFSIKNKKITFDDASIFLQKYKEKIELIDGRLNKIVGKNVRNFQSDIFESFTAEINNQLNFENKEFSCSHR